MTLALAWLFLKNSFYNVLSFCSKPPGSWLAAALLVGVGFWWLGQHEFNRGVASVEAKQVIATARLVKAQDKITVNVGNIYADVRLTIANDTNRRINEVPTHVTPEADRNCVVPLGFVRVLNDAAHGPVPGPAAGADEAPSGIPLSDVAKTDVLNLGDKDAVAAQLTALQDWIRQQQALSEKN